MTNDAVTICRETIGEHSKSFAFASALLPPRVRDEVCILYHWCRRADDMVDECTGDPHEAVARLEAELDAIYGGAHLEDVTLAAMQQIVRDRYIPAHYPRELLAGMAMDAQGTRYRDLESLLLYCYRVAGVVGLMMSHVLGVRDPVALKHALHLGLAMQITNISRDVLEDWNRGRLYLPGDLLARHGAPGLVHELGRPLSRAHGPAIARTLRDLLHEADRFYRSADLGLDYLSWRSALAVRTARMVYSAIGNRIAAQRYDVFAGRAYVSKPTKVVKGLQALGLASVDWPGRFQRVPLREVIRFPRDVYAVK